MQKRSSKTPRDPNQLAAHIVALTTGSEPTPAEDKPKNAAAVALGRLGGLKGGKARAAKLTPKKRQEIARKAAESRWNSKDKRT